MISERGGVPYYLHLPSMGPRSRPWLSGLAQASEPGPETLPFDASLPWPGVGDNRGCFPGYFAQRVAVGEFDASQPASVGIVSGGPTAIRCRRMDYLDGTLQYTGAINAAETGQAAAESWYQTTKGVGDFFSKVGLTLGTGLHGILSWALVGGALYFLIIREQGKR